jgi:hypothetical protein
MDTNRRTFLALALSGVVLAGSWGVAVAEDPAGEIVGVTLNVQGMH